MTLGVNKKKSAWPPCERCGAPAGGNGNTVDEYVPVKVWGSHLCYPCTGDHDTECPRFGESPLGSWAEDQKAVVDAYEKWTRGWCAQGKPK